MMRLFMRTTVGILCTVLCLCSLSSAIPPRVTNATYTYREAHVLDMTATMVRLTAANTALQ